MRSVTTHWRAQNSVLSLSPKPQWKPLSPCCLLSLQPRNCFSKLFLRTVPSRHCSQWGANTCQQQLRRFVRTSNSEDYVVRFLDSAESIQITQDRVSSSNAIMERKLRKESENVTDFLFSDHPIGRYLKLMTVFGCVTLHVSHPALAASDFSVPYLQDLGDISTGFASAFLLIFFSELGDKTFFIAAILAARNSAAVIFTGTFGALAVMSVISVALGRTFHYVDEILPFSFGGNDLPLDDIAAVLLLVYFGVSTLLDASSGDGQKAEEEQKEAELAVSDFSGNGAGAVAAANTVISTFALVFVAEWGDKSFFSTIALSAASSPLGVIAGALAGHGVATLLAVLGGSLLGSFLSEKAIAYVGGILFLVFAAITLVDIIN